MASTHAARLLWDFGGHAVWDFGGHAVWVVVCGDST
jgi:hypothetical protein